MFVKTFFQNISIMPKADSRKSPEVHFYGHVGPSMNPTLNKEDLLEVAPYRKDVPKVGDVILFQTPANDMTIVHRIVHIKPEGYVTRGDNCSDRDPWLVARKNIHGQIIAAHRGSKRRLISNGYWGKLTGIFCHLKRRVSNLLVRFLGPVYRSLSTGGYLHWLIPVRLTPQVATFQSDTNASHKLLLGRRIIGSYDESLLQWQIRRPFRLFVNEASLPKPR